MDDHIMRHGTIGSWQSAATSEIVKCCWSRVHSCKCRYSKCPDLYLDLYRLGFHVTFLVCSANHVVFTSPPVQTGRSRNVFYCPFVRYKICERNILKTNEPISIKSGATGRRGTKPRNWSAWQWHETINWQATLQAEQYYMVLSLSLLPLLVFSFFTVFPMF